MQIAIINGSYRVNGVTDQILAVMEQQLVHHGVTVEHIILRELNIHYCQNCRSCMQVEQHAPGHCHQQDDMARVISSLERSDGLILASPTNMGTVTALYKCFMERLAVYGHWPFGQSAPKYRHGGRLDKRALLVTSSAAPAWMAYWAFNTHKMLAKSAYFLGAKVVGRLSIGLQSQPLPITLNYAHVVKAQRLVDCLLKA